MKVESGGYRYSVQAGVSMTELDQKIIESVSIAIDEIKDHCNPLGKFTFVLIGKNILEKSSFKQGETLLGVEIASDFRNPTKISLGYEIADFSDVLTRLEW